MGTEQGWHLCLLSKCDFCLHLCLSTVSSYFSILPCGFIMFGIQPLSVCSMTSLQFPQRVVPKAASCTSRCFVCLCLFLLPQRRPWRLHDGAVSVLHPGAPSAREAGPRAALFDGPSVHLNSGVDLFGVPRRSVWTPLGRWGLEVKGGGSTPIYSCDTPFIANPVVGQELIHQVRGAQTVGAAGLRPKGGPHQK